ncbi:MAG: hypothetical protein CSB48_09995 [Proteobacteria bacterium]|nr:MAG: hypothetical protein CSB48_09995 [Pseudomonadota bacterium]
MITVQDGDGLHDVLPVAANRNRYFAPSRQVCPRLEGVVFFRRRLALFRLDRHHFRCKNGPQECLAAVRVMTISLLNKGFIR